jgi:hypothetical protein
VCEKEAGGEGKEDRAHYYTVARCTTLTHLVIFKKKLQAQKTALFLDKVQVL